MRCSEERYRFAAIRVRRSVPGTARSTRWTSASLPVLITPSSVSTAACSVTTHAGRGCGRLAAPGRGGLVVETATARLAGGLGFVDIGVRLVVVQRGAPEGVGAPRIVV